MISHPTPRSSLTTWSHEHINAIFEAPTDSAALSAISSTFAPNVQATLNGKPLHREGIDKLVLMIRKGAVGKGKGLKVRWLAGVEASSDQTHQAGSFGGYYILSGIETQEPGSDTVEEYERHKSVAVEIESMDADPEVDSRRIVNLVFIASNVRVGK